jgi:putative DNA primase/helicase
MRQDFFTYEPQFLLVAAGNHKPSFKGVDEAIRRRVNLIPFLQNIPAEERDKDLPEKLKAEWPAILRWMIDGCLAWQKARAEPAQVGARGQRGLPRRRGRARQWLEERCTISGKIEFTGTNVLYDDWRSWCDRSGLPTGSAKSFSQRLSERGLTRSPRKDTRGFVGIGLRPPFQQPSTPPRADVADTQI